MLTELGKGMYEHSEKLNKEKENIKVYLTKLVKIVRYGSRAQGRKEEIYAWYCVQQFKQIK